MLPALLLGLAACNGEAPAADSAATSTEATTEAESGTGEPEPEPEPLDGYADLHLHMFAEEAFGGGWFHGQAEGPAEIALSMCDGGVPGDHARLRDDLATLFMTCDQALVDQAAASVPDLQAILLLGGAAVSEFLGSIPGSEGDTGTHQDRPGGWPDLVGWPRWDVIAHQQAWEGWLEDAYDSGLRVSVMSAVSLDWLCRALPDENVKRPECDEMADVRIQLQMANSFAASHDWVEIALTPADVRRIVGEDKLAMVLSIEASHIFGTDDWEAGLDEVYALGVRTLQIVHQLDNRFGGAAPHNSIFQMVQFNESCHIDTDCALTGNVTLGFDVDNNCRNTRGLTEDGAALIDAMMDRGMLIDLAHMSEELVRDVHERAVANDYYPLYFSHAHFREMMLPAKAKEEKTTPAWVVEMVRETGGMIGLRTAHEEVNDYLGSEVANSCHGSSRSFAQAYDFGRLGLDVSMGLGSDLNGFIQQTRPRFGPDACSASFPLEATCQAKDERMTGVDGVGTVFDEAGLGHLGTLGDLLDDLDALGTDTAPLRRSANDFVLMWERAAGDRSGPAAEPFAADVDNIVVNPPHAARLAEFPTQCDTAYCPGGTTAGDVCKFDAECESGVCAGAGTCGSPKGVCE